MDFLAGSRHLTGNRYSVGEGATRYSININVTAKPVSVTNLHLPKVGPLGSHLGIAKEDQTSVQRSMDVVKSRRQWDKKRHVNMITREIRYKLKQKTQTLTLNIIESVFPDQWCRFTPSTVSYQETLQNRFLKKKNLGLLPLFFKDGLLIQTIFDSVPRRSKSLSSVAHVT